MASQVRQASGIPRGRPGRVVRHPGGPREDQSGATRLDHGARHSSPFPGLRARTRRGAGRALSGRGSHCRSFSRAVLSDPMADVRERLEAALAEHYAIDRELGAGGMATVYVARDLKHGRAVVADFGIALAVSAAAGSRLTETGLSLGTPQYMSPEQATGDRLIDARSDIYSLATVLYEMLAGEPPITGPTVQSVIAKVVTDRPRPLRQLRESVPPHVEAAVVKALAKVRADRFQTAAQFAEALARPGAATAPRHVGGLALREVAPWAIAGLATGLALWVALRPRPERGARPVARFTLALRPGAPLAEFSAGPTVALSPDGSRIVYVSSTTTGNQLFSRKLGELEPVALAGTQNARGPVFSPDGRWVAYFSNGKLYKLPLTRGGGGGSPVTVADVLGLVLGATWGESDTIAFRSDKGLMTVAAAGGEPRLLLQADSSRGESYLVPHYLPDAKALLLQIPSPGIDRVGAPALPTRQLTRFTHPGTHPQDTPPAHFC